MKKLLTLLSLLYSITAIGQYKELRKINPHTGISANAGIDVEYVYSDKNELIIESEKKEYLEKIVTDVKNNVLSIHYKPNSKITTKKANKVTIYSNSNLDKIKVTSSAKLNITDPIVTNSLEIIASSSGKLVLTTINAQNIKINASSSAKIESKAINTKTIHIEATSSSKTSLSGTLEKVFVQMSSSANVNLLNTIINNLTVSGSSSAKLTINTANSINSNLSSSAQVIYKTQPKNIIENKVSSGGQLIQH